MRRRHLAASALLSATLAVAGLPAPLHRAAGKQEAARIDRYGDPLPKGAVARIGTLRFCQPFPTTLAFSPDGKILASGGGDNRIRLWDPDTGKELRALEGHQGYVNGIAFSADGKWLASRGEDKLLCLWDVASGKEWRRFTERTAPIEGMALSPDGKVLASRFLGGTPRLWDTGTGKEIRSLLIDKGNQVGVMRFTPDSKHLAFYNGSDKVFQLVSVADGKLVRTFEGHKKNVYELIFNADGSTLFSVGSDNTIRAWDVASGKELRRYGDEKALVRCLALAPDGKTLTYGTYPDGLVHIRDTAANKAVVAPWKANRWCIVSIAYSPDSKKVALGRDTIAIHDTATGKRLNQSPESESRVKQVEYSADGKRLAVWRDGEGIELWDTAKWQKAATIQAKTGWFTSMASSPGGKYLTTAEGDINQGRSICHWDPQTGKLEKELPQGKGWLVESLSYTADGGTLACMHMHQASTFLLWDAETGKERGRITFAPGDGRRSRLSPDGGLIACRGSRNAVALYDEHSAKAIRAFGKILPGARELFAFSPDGRTIATPGGQGLVNGIANQTDVVLWETATGRERLYIAMNEGVLGQVAFSPDGRLLATAGRTETIRLWDTWTGQEVGRFTGHRGWIGSLAFAPDGKTLASGGADTIVLIWDMSGLTKGAKGADIEWTRKDLERMWETLADEDAGKAAPVIGALAQAPGRAEPFLREVLGKMAAGDGPKIRQLIADLDSAKFAVREKATDALARLGKRAEPALRQALQAKPTPEASRRVEHLLSKLGEAGIDSTWLRTLRAIEVLERLGTAEARQALETLAKGYGEDRVGQEAQASLGRMAKRSAGR
jgi:WD40 repeat protein